MRIRFNCEGASDSDIAELREFHPCTDIQVRILPNGSVLAIAGEIQANYVDMFGMNLAEYIRHAINCSFFVKSGYENGVIL